MNRRIAACIVSITLIVASGSTWAGGRPDKSWKSWFGNLAIGYAAPQGESADTFDDGWWIDGGATWWPETAMVGLDLDIFYSDYDAKDEVVRTINDLLEADGQGRPIDGADLQLSGVTADVIWGPDGGGKIGFYIAAGVGMYYHRARVKTNALFYYPPGCGIYWCFPGGVGSGTNASTLESGWDWGYNAGLGLNIEVGSSGSQLYIEAKYHSAQTDHGSIDVVPVMIGYRW